MEHKSQSFFSEIICSNGKTVSTAIGFWNAGLKVEDLFRRDFSNIAPSVFRTLGKGLGCVLIKSTLGPGKTQKGWKLGREGNGGQKGDSLRATWD
jgi:hypothetical protein